MIFIILNQNAVSHIGFTSAQEVVDFLYLHVINFLILWIYVHIM